jgi:hypothetical protein
MGGHDATTGEAETKPGRHGDGAGLSQLVRSRQAKFWVFRYMRHGKAPEMGLGPADGRAAVPVRRREHCTMPTGLDWLHEVKYDGYRMVIRDRDRVRLISNGGHDWARHFPLIIEAALKLRQRHFVR